MEMLLSMKPIEFLLRYTVISGIVIAVLGVVLCLIAKRVTMMIRKQETLDRNDGLYTAIMLVGLALILIGMIVMVLPFEATFYRG